MKSLKSWVAMATKGILRDMRTMLAHASAFSTAIFMLNQS